jgi:hypothetical protein
MNQPSYIPPTETLYVAWFEPGDTPPRRRNIPAMRVIAWKITGDRVDAVTVAGPVTATEKTPVLHTGFGTTRHAARSEALAVRA